MRSPAVVRTEVSIHAPGWARRARPSGGGSRRSFNSRARVGATRPHPRPQHHHRVSIHAPGWARPRMAMPRWEATEVSIHAPGWARHPQTMRSVPANVVSIHAPGWARLAPALHFVEEPPGVSIHAPGWARLRVRPVALRRLGVSIHAPGWARLTAGITDRMLRAFQFTRPGGRDRFCPVIRGASVRFNSRARVGATIYRLPPRAIRSCFNSRARVGATSSQLLASEIHSAFQFTRPGGRDWIANLLDLLADVSIHAPGWARRKVPTAEKSRLRFNSRARVGAT